MTNEASSWRASQCVEGCPPRNRGANGQHTDAAKRAADWINLAIAAEGALACGQWLAVKLADGDSDGQLYPTQTAAVRSAGHNAKLYAYFRVPRTWVTLCECESFLRFNRMRYDAGMGTMPDPRDVIPPLTNEGARKQEEQLQAITGRPLSDYLN